jgi:hypothetical protein
MTKHSSLRSRTNSNLIAHGITQDLLRKVFDYNKFTGELTWRIRPRDHFKKDYAWHVWNNRYAGNVAGCERVSKRNKSIRYWVIRINRRPYGAHQLIYLRETGEIALQIDHIDGYGLNNRIENLRSATSTENNRNAALRVSNTSGITGVSWNKGRQKWRAFIKINNCYVYLGSFAEKTDAITARKTAESHHGFHPNHGLRREDRRTAS